MQRHEKRLLVWLWVIFAVVVAVLFAVLFRLQHRAERLLESEAQLSGQIAAFERSIGYGGFIHDFNNMILRPDEEIHAERAAAAHARATVLLDEIERTGRDAHEALDLTPLRETLAQYGEMLALARGLVAEGQGARAIDARIRVSDERALRALDALVTEVTAGLDRRIDRLRFLMMLAFVIAGAGFAGAIGASAAIYLRSHRRDLEVLVRKLEVHNEELERLCQIAAHDLRAPLRQIRQLAGLVREDLEADGRALPEPVAEGLDDIDRRSGKLDQMVREVLGLMRDGTSSRPAEPVELRTLVEDVASFVIPTGVECRLAGEFPVIDARPEELRTVLRNLLGNAVKHGDADKPEIVVRCRTERDSVVLEVEDNGPGVPPDARERIFEMFRSLAAPADETAVTGVGLAQVRRIVRSWGGDVVVRDGAGQGAVFAVTVPPA